MKSLPAKILIKILEQNGFWCSRIRGSHHIYVNNQGIAVTVPVHNANKEIPIGTFLNIVRESKIERKLFKK